MFLLFDQILFSGKHVFNSKQKKSFYCLSEKKYSKTKGALEVSGP